LSNLNLHALRGFFLVSDADSHSSSELTQLSRRDFIRLSGASAVAGPSILPSLGSVEVIGDVDRLSFKLGGIERWIIDPRQFSGSPRLKIRRKTRSIYFSLTGARFPGTELTADLECEIVNRMLDWQMNLRLALGGCRYSASFERWLLGNEAATCDADLSRKQVLSRGGLELEIGGPAQVGFSPDWRLSFRGASVIRVSRQQFDLSTDRVSLGLAGPTEPSLGNVAPLRRSVVFVSRGLNNWKIDHNFDSASPWKLAIPGNFFDSIRIELREECNGSTSQVLAAESELRSDLGHLCVGEELIGDDGKPLRIPLGRAQYAVSFGDGGFEAAFLARIAESQPWAHSNGLSFGLANKAEGPTVEILKHNDETSKIRFVPNLTWLAAPFSGAAMRLSAVSDRVGMDFSWDPDHSAEDSGQSSFDLENKSACISMEGYRLSVLRPDDFLALSFEFSNLCLKYKHGEGVLQRIDLNKPGILIARFPPQSIAEQAFLEGANSASSEPLTEAPVESRLSGGSRLAFEVANEIPFTLSGLLGWKVLKPSLSSLAQPAGGKPGPTEPQLPEAPPLPTQTAIELPYRLYLSPNSFSFWEHRDQENESKVASKTPQDTALTKGDDCSLGTRRHELWHARLGSKDSKQQNVRAIWSWDYDPDPTKRPPMDNKPFRMSMARPDRHEIVHLSADFKLINGGASPSPCSPYASAYDPVPIQVSRLMLSSLGGWLDSRGAWPIPKGNNLSIEEWRHVATLARDHYVRIIKKGYLLPFGNRASLVTITERKFQRSPVTGKVTAYLRQRIYILVRQPIKSYEYYDEHNKYQAGAPCQPFQGRKLPFRSVEITTLVTPNLDDPTKTQLNHLGQEGFWPTVGGVPFQFQVIGTDRCEPANKCKFTLPLVFVGVNVTDICLYPSLDSLKAVLAEYNDPAKQDARRVTEFQGQAICYARNTKPGDTQLSTNHVIFGAEPYDPSSDMGRCFMLYDQPAFFPTLDCAEVSVSSVQQLTGSQAPTWIYFHDTYVKSGFSVPENKGEVFAAFVNPVSLQFGTQGTATVSTKSDKSGGVATPNMAILGLSRRFGPVSGPAAAAPVRPDCWLAPKPAVDHRARAAAAGSDPLSSFISGTFNPLEYFKDQINARILGVISLADVIPELKDFTNQIEKVPQLINQVHQELLKDIAPVQTALVNFLNTLKVPAQAVDHALQGIQSQIKQARQQVQATVLVGMKKLQADVQATVSAVPSVPSPGLLDAHAFVKSVITDKLRAIDSTLQLAVEDEAELENRITALVGNFTSELAKFADSSQSDVVKAFDGVDSSLNTCQLLTLITKLQNDVTALDLQSLHDDLFSSKANLRDLLENIARFKTLLPDGSAALAKITQNARNFLQHSKDNSRSSLSLIRDQVGTDLQQIHDHAAQQMQAAISALQTQAQQTVSDLETAVSNEIQNAIDTVIDKALDQVWPIVEAALAPVSGALEQIEELRQTLAALTDLMAVPIEASANLSWKPELHNYPSSGTPVFEVDNGTDSLKIDVTIVTRLRISGGQPSVSYNVNGTLKKFSVCLLPAVQPFIKIHFESLIFTASNSAKLNIQAKITAPPDGIQFLGVLEFVKDLEDKLANLTKGTGPFIEISESGVLAGLRMALPAITVGAMSLQNISISAAINLPFTGQPVRFRFAFAERQNPCLLTVGVFGGGFFVGLSIGLDGIELFEGAFEFGGNFAFDVPAVSGRAYAMAGVYFRAEGQVTLITGYFHSGGVLDVFGIISIYLDIYVGLSYETSSAGTVASGDAIVTASIHIGFFSVSASFSYHKEFQGSQNSSARASKATLNTSAIQAATSSLPSVGPSRVGDLMNRNAWKQYCRAFAEV
jgi:hypothetical protein